jgi:hypothetical protein
MAEIDAALADIDRKLKAPLTNRLDTEARVANGALGSLVQRCREQRRSLVSVSTCRRRADRDRAERGGAAQAVRLSPDSRGK